MFCVAPCGRQLSIFYSIAPHSKEIWGVLLHKSLLQPVFCALPTDMIESILSRVDANCKDLESSRQIDLLCIAWNCGEN